MLRSSSQISTSPCTSHDKSLHSYEGGELTLNSGTAASNLSLAASPFWRFLHAMIKRLASSFARWTTVSYPRPTFAGGEGGWISKSTTCGGISLASRYNRCSTAENGRGHSAVGEELFFDELHDSSGLEKEENELTNSQENAICAENLRVSLLRAEDRSVAQVYDYNIQNKWQKTIHKNPSTKEFLPLLRSGRGRSEFRDELHSNLEEEIRR